MENIKLKNIIQEVMRENQEDGFVSARAFLYSEPDRPRVVIEDSTKTNEGNTTTNKDKIEKWLKEIDSKHEFKFYPATGKFVGKFSSDVTSSKAIKTLNIKLQHIGVKAHSKPLTKALKKQ